jgi:hypothetical protein
VIGLKTICAVLVHENKNISKNQKIGILEYIKETPDSEIESLFKPEMIEQIVKEDVTAQALGAILGGPFWVLWRAIGATISKKRRLCGTLRISNQRTMCIQRVSIDELKKKINMLSSALATCRKTEDPGLCKDRVTNAMQSMKKRLEKKEEKFKYKWGSQNK